MTAKSAIRAEAERLLAFFEAGAAKRIETDILQPAEILLDLYGEDIRTRAYVTHDPVHGELMLRPDFTVPVVQMHMANGARPARYTYVGKVFRKQDTTSHRTSEYLQVGYEVFDSHDPARTDAEVFLLITRALSRYGFRAATGDIGLLRAAVHGLDTTERRKAALLRHLWRPRRFRALLDRFCGRRPMPEARARLLAASDPLADAGLEIGLRSRAEVEARIAALKADAAEPPVPPAEAEVLDALLDIRDSLPGALPRLAELADRLPALGPAVAAFRHRLEALESEGVDVRSVTFEASFGRTSLEYYDGFVFGFFAEGRPDMPPVATGGRYDALTQALGRGRSMPAVGGVIRPGLVLELRNT